jgi:5-methylcytosine-specific restriction protein A
VLVGLAVSPTYGRRTKGRKRIGSPSSSTPCAPRASSDGEASSSLQSVDRPRQRPARLAPLSHPAGRPAGATARLDGEQPAHHERDARRRPELVGAQRITRRWRRGDLSSSSGRATRVKHPCLTCGRACTGSYCDRHRGETERRRGTRTQRGYDDAWVAKSRRVVRAWVRAHGWTCPGYRDTAEHASRDLTVHHVVPLSRGGTSDDANLIVLCRSCHARLEADRGGGVPAASAPHAPNPPPVSRVRGR